MKVDLAANARKAVAIAKGISVDLYSDTNTRPTAGMRQAIANAECGNEQALEDPTTNDLQERVAALLGKEAAVYLPSGAMCNEIAYRVWGRPGDEIIMDQTGHALLFETGGPAALSGLMIKQLAGPNGIFSQKQFEAATKSFGRHAPRARIVNIENTTNLGGGCIWPLENIKAIADIARTVDIKVHMDGARLMNAVVASGIAARDFAAHVDSVWIDFSKGLGCPMGGVLAGSAEFIDEAFRMKHQFGGALRQSGIVTSACLYALDHHIERLADDHANATRLHAGLSNMPGIQVQNESCETNLVFFDVSGSKLTAPALSAALLERGIRIGAMSDTLMRAVTHMDVDESDIGAALDTISEFIS
jgi:threonine aldolase